MSMYVFAPAGPRELRNNLLRVAIEYIGSKQKGIGSPWAKGKRYLRNQLSCSGTAIKRACAVENKILNHDFQQYGTSVYYYQKRDCARIVEAVMSYIADHINADVNVNEKIYQSLAKKFTTPLTKKFTICY